MSEIYNSKTYKIRIDREHEIAEEVMFELAAQYLKDHPEVGKKILEAIEVGTNISCPFPHHCNEFPCEGLCCNADTCSNGHAFRMS